MVGVLVVDSAPIINSSHTLSALAQKYVTVPEVLKELKDKATRDALEKLPFQLETKSPSEEAILKIVHFSKLTGDYPSLSIVDIKVLALTLQLEWELVGREHLKEDMEKPVVTKILTLGSR